MTDNTEAQATVDEAADLDVNTDDVQTIQSVLEEKSRLREDAGASIARLLKKNKFNRGDIARCFAKMQQYLDFVDSFQELILNDLQIIDTRFRKTEENLFKIGQQQTILVTTLKEKNVVTDPEMLDAWEKKVKPELEARVAEIQAAAAKTDAGQAPLTTATEPVVV